MNANSTFNGGDLFCLVGMGYIVFICLNGPQSPTFFLSTEASGSIGYGVFYSWEWFNGAWSVAQQSLSIAYKELFPIVLSCYVLGGGGGGGGNGAIDVFNLIVITKVLLLILEHLKTVTL